MRRFITIAALGAAFLAPAVASAFHNGEVVIGGYRLPQNHRFESPNAQGKYEVVDINQVPSMIAQGRAVFDRTANTWIKHPNGTINTAYQASGSTTASTAPGRNRDWQNIHGSVTSVTGSTLTMRADDGRTLSVDMGKVSPEIQRNLTPGERVTVATHNIRGNNVRAEFIQKDSSAGVQPSAAPSATVDDKAWQRIHGTVSSVSGAQLMFKADDGRDLTVDMKDVNESVQKALTPGERATVIGFYRGNDKNVQAKFIQQDSSAK